MSPLTPVLIEASCCADLLGIFEVAASSGDMFKGPRDPLLARAILDSLSSWVISFLIFEKIFLLYSDSFTVTVTPCHKR